MVRKKHDMYIYKYKGGKGDVKKIKKGRKRESFQRFIHVTPLFASTCSAYLAHVATWLLPSPFLSDIFPE